MDNFAWAFTYFSKETTQFSGNWDFVSKFVLPSWKAQTL
jgi:hypothetical protein